MIDNAKPQAPSCQIQIPPLHHANLMHCVHKLLGLAIQSEDVLDLDLDTNMIVEPLEVAGHQSRGEVEDALGSGAEGKMDTWSAASTSGSSQTCRFSWWPSFSVTYGIYCPTDYAFRRVDSFVYTYAASGVVVAFSAQKLCTGQAHQASP